MQLTLGIIFGILCIFSLMDMQQSFYKKYSTVRLIFYVFSVMLLWFCAAFRFGDNDYQNYVNVFNRGTSSYMEIGYMFLNKVLHYFGATPTIFFAFFALLSVGTMSVFIYKYNRYAFLGLLIFFVHPFILRDMMQIRSAFAIAGCMFCIPAIHDRNLLKTIAIVGLMSTIHFVAFFWLTVYFAYPILRGKSKIIFIVILIGIALGGIIGLDFFTSLSQHLNMYALDVYVENTDYNYSLGLLNPVLIKQIGVILLVMFNYNSLKTKIPYLDVLLVSYCIACFVLSAFNSFALLAGRIATLFANVEHILIPSLLLLKHRWINYIVILLYAVFVFYTKQEYLENLNFVFLK